MKLRSPLFSSLASVAFLMVSVTHALEVTNVTARQRWPWNNLVDIDFVLSTNGTEGASVFGIDVDGSFSNGTRAVSAATFITPTDVSAGTNRVTWNLGADYPGMRLADLELRVIALPVMYLVVDLSGGTNAAAYPVQYTAQAPDLSDDTCRTDKLWLRYIPAGSFTMGSPTTELGHYTDGRETLHAVTLTKGFYMGIFEVTQKQWYNVMGTKPSFYTNLACWATRPVETVSYNLLRGSVSGALWPSSSAVDTNSFMGVLRAKTGLAIFDLPSNAQSEYACRAGTTTGINSGIDLTNTTYDANLDLLARYRHNSGAATNGSVSDSEATAKVGSYLPNAWGLYDTHGNVWEICLDWYTANLGEAALIDPRGPYTATDRTYRGGGCYDFSRELRSAYRGNIPVTFVHARIGFRLATNQP